MAKITSCFTPPAPEPGMPESPSAQFRKATQAPPRSTGNRSLLKAMTTSGLVLDLIEAFRRSKTMFVATSLGIFDGKRPTDVKELARLLDACVALGLLEKRDDGEY